MIKTLFLSNSSIDYILDSGYTKEKFYEINPHRQITASLLVLPLLVFVAAPSNAGSKLKSANYTVNANSSTPFDTDFNLTKGQSVKISASGLGCFSETVYPLCWDANGDSLDQVWVGFPAPNLNAWSLIARVGDGDWQFVGVGPTTITADTSGTLQLLYNDDNVGDNTGYFDVLVGVYYGYGTGDNNKTHVGPKKLL